MKVHIFLMCLAITAAALPARPAECPDSDLPTNAAQSRAGHDGLSDEDRYILKRVKSFMAKNGLVLAPPPDTIRPPSAPMQLRPQMPSFEELMSAWIAQQQQQQQQQHEAPPGAGTSRLFMPSSPRDESRPGRGPPRPAMPPKQTLAEVPVRSATVAKISPVNVTVRVAKPTAINVTASTVVQPPPPVRSGPAPTRYQNTAPSRSSPNSPRNPNDKSERSPLVIPAQKPALGSERNITPGSNASFGGLLKPTTTTPEQTPVKSNDGTRRETKGPFTPKTTSNATQSTPDSANVTWSSPDVNPGRSLHVSITVPTPVPSLRESTWSPKKGPTSSPGVRPPKTAQPSPTNNITSSPTPRPTTSVMSPVPSQRERTELKPSASPNSTSDYCPNVTDMASESSLNGTTPLPTNTDEETDAMGQSGLGNVTSDGNSTESTPEDVPVSNATEVEPAALNDNVGNVTSESGGDDADSAPISNSTVRSSLKNVWVTTSPRRSPTPSEMSLADVKALETNRTYTSRVTNTSESETPTPQPADVDVKDSDTKPIDSESETPMGVDDGGDENWIDDDDDGMDDDDDDDEPKALFRASDDNPISSALSRSYN